MRINNYVVRQSLNLVRELFEGILKRVQDLRGVILEMRVVGAVALVLAVCPFGAQGAAVAVQDPCDHSQKYVPIADRYTKGVFFVVKKCGIQPDFLLGTMHSDEPRVTDMLGNVFSRLAYASSATFEIKFDPAAMKTVMEGMYLDPNSIETLQSIISVSVYTKYVDLMKKLQPTTPETAFYRMKPWAAAVMLQEPPNSGDGVALDLKLQNFAKARGIPVAGLETAESQMKIFEDVPQSKQIEFLRDTVDNYQQIEKDNKELTDIYLAQDLTRLQALGDKSFDTISDHEFASKLKLELVDKRNRRMVAGMAPILEKGNAFVAIGALHLTGKEGILKQLEDKGFYIDVDAGSN